MLPIFPQLSTPLPPPHISSHLATKNIECEEKEIAELESFLKILNQMLGSVHTSSISYRISGQSRGDSALGTEPGWGWGGGGGSCGHSEMLFQLFPKLGGEAGNWAASY